MRARISSFPGASLSCSVHAEQAAVYNAWVHGETGITQIATTAAPCGFCRQFLNELAGASELRVAVHGLAPTTLAELLPAAFGPRDLETGDRLMQTAARAFVLAGPDQTDDPVVAAALSAACLAYAPYSRTYAGVGLLTRDGMIVQGRYAENAAFNPTLSPMQGAMIELALGGRLAVGIAEAVLVETAEPTAGREDEHLVSQRASSIAILSSVAPGVPLTYLRARPATAAAAQAPSRGTTAAVQGPDPGAAATVQGPGGLDSTDNSGLS